MALKTKTMKNIWDPIEIQLKKLKYLYHISEKQTPEMKSIKAVVLEHFYEFNKKLMRFLNNDSADYTEMMDAIVKIIDDFDSMDTIVNVDEENVLEKVLDNFYTALRTLERCECVELKAQLQDAWEYVKEMGDVKDIEDFENIKELGTSLLDAIGSLQIYGRNLTSVSLKEKTILFTCQLSSAFLILANVVKEQHYLKRSIYNTKAYACNRICQCLTMITDVLDAENPSEDEEILEKEQHFVYKMDLALDVIANISGAKGNQSKQIELCQELWIILEEVFSHTMAVAQVCLPEHFEAITGISKGVIGEYENLKDQLISDKYDNALNNLFINTFTDSLYRLERQVNISMLSLVMEVFSEPFGPLKKLVNLCGNSLPPHVRRKSDLSNAIEDFDQISDKIIQIGLYAIACCGDVNKVARIRNYIASLESLDLELVTSITSFYLEPLNKEYRTGVKLLTTQWQNEVNKFHIAIDLIIDSAAYCQVMLDDLQGRLQVINASFENNQSVTVPQIKIIVYRACALASQVTAVVDDIGRENFDTATIMTIRELKAAIFEADAAAKTFLGPNAQTPKQLRVIKRCELLINVIKTLQPILVMIMSKSQSINANKSRYGQGDALQNILNLSPNMTNVVFVRTPYTVKNYKPSISIQVPNSTQKPLDMSCLLPYIKRGREMRCEKSIMYKTPKDLNKSKDTTELKSVNESKDSNESKDFNNSMDSNILKDSNNSKDLKQLKDINNSKDSNSSANSGAKIKVKRNLSCVRQHLFSRDSFISNKDVDLTSISIDLSGILDRISTLSTDSSSGGYNNFPINSMMQNKIRCGKCENSSTGGGDAPSALINTPQRMYDIQKIGRKIKNLQYRNN